MKSELFTLECWHRNDAWICPRWFLAYLGTRTAVVNYSSPSKGAIHCPIPSLATTCPISSVTAPLSPSKMALGGAY
eukprot:3563788-Rhodomonas_salina.2